jgi:hypothetical protein
LLVFSIVSVSITESGDGRTAFGELGDLHPKQQRQLQLCSGRMSILRFGGFIICLHHVENFNDPSDIYHTGRGVLFAGPIHRSTGIPSGKNPDLVDAAVFRSNIFPDPSLFSDCTHTRKTTHCK